MAELIALDLPGGPAFVDELERVWDEGDAVLPVDQRLPDLARRELLDRFGASAVVTDRGHRTDLARGVPVEPGDAAVVATSGSSGTPKGVVLTHDAIAASAAATSARLEVSGDDHWLACLPLSHVGGLSVVFRALHAGTALTVLPRFDVEAVERSGATLVSLVATALRRIDPSRFRVIVLGGARPPADRPPNTVATYGMTETGSGIVYDGRPLDGVELRIVDDEIQVRGPMLLRCYRDGTDPLTDDGWFPTGDLGSIDRSGRLHVDGRRHDLIITGGENVWPEPIEAMLRRHPSVSDAAVYGAENPEWGQEVTACVVPTPGSTIELDDLREWVKTELPAFHAPRRVVVCEELPRTALGKPIRAQLRALDG
ncbi:MAG: long-chain fatty acid--CoA ligase [Ilumatobacter sp.]|nr:long-chain fatty acid--CoA ligase [Ilumatobacter sp.]